MNKLDKWVDVRKKQIQEANDVKITIKKLEDLNCYFTVKEINSIDENNELYKNNNIFRKVDKGYKILEYTPINKNYNVRAFVNEKNEILQYYLDVTDGMELRDGVPFYNDLYLDVIDYSNHDFFKKHKEGCDKKNLYIEDADELNEALESGKISQQQFDKAYYVANELINEIKLGTNIYINRGIEDFLKLKNM